jgi:hypothetical protein
LDESGLTFFYLDEDADNRGVAIGVEYVEAFVLVRELM